MRNWGAMAGRLPTCVVLSALSGCAVLPGAGMPFPGEAHDPVAEEAPAEPSVQRVSPPPPTPPAPTPPPSTPPPLLPDRGAQEPQTPALPPLEPLVVTQLDEAAPLPVLDEQILSLLLSEPQPVPQLLRLLLRETDVSLVLDPDIDDTFSGELKDVTLRQALELVLRPLDLDYTVEDGVLLVVRRPLQTRVFEVNFVTTRRVCHQAGDRRVRRRYSQPDGARLDRRPRLLHRAGASSASAAVGQRTSPREPGCRTAAGH